MSTKKRRKKEVSCIRVPVRLIPSLVKLIYHNSATRYVVAEWIEETTIYTDIDRWKRESVVKSKSFDTHAISSATGLELSDVVTVCREFTSVGILNCIYTPPVHAPQATHVYKCVPHVHLTTSETDVSTEKNTVCSFSELAAWVSLQPHNSIMIKP
jgi:hypothetical protein